MTISATTNRVSYAGNGVTTGFSFPYPIHDPADFLVYKVTDSTGVETLQTYLTDYTFSGTAVDGVYPSGGTITAAVAPASGVTYVIVRDPALEQDLDLEENDSFPPNEIEKRLDKLTLITQRLYDMASRSLRLPDGYNETFDTTLPENLFDGGGIVRVNEAGDGIEIVASLTDLATAGAVYTDGTGDLYSEQYLDRTRGGTGITSTATFPASGTIVTRTASETLTNKTMSGTSNTFSAIPHASLAVAGAGFILMGNASTVVEAIQPTGDVTISSGGVTAIGAGVIVNADINASAAIAFSKLAGLTAGNVLVGNGSNVATSVALSGDITVSSGGVVAIGAGKVTNAMLAGSIAASKLVGTDIATVGTVTAGTWSASVITETKGGTAQSSYALGDTLYSSAANTLSKLSGNTSATLAVLTQTGNGTVSAAPVWTTTTGTGNVVMSAGPTLTGTLTASVGTFSGLLTATKGASLGITIGDASTNSNSKLRMQGTSAGYNYALQNNVNVAGLEITGSTATGGTSYSSNPIIAFYSNGSIGNVVMGAAALATNATDGFFYIASGAGAPSGTPTSYAGRVAMYYDSSNNKFYVFNGAWKSVTLT
jgi:hypothetical protein